MNSYDDFLRRLNQRFQAFSSLPMFTTDTEGLFDIYLDAQAPEERQHYNCNACRRFVEMYGGLVAIPREGTPNPIMWDSEETAPGVAQLRARVKAARVTGVFYSSAPEWGQSVTGPWHHLAVQPEVRFKHLTMTATQAMAEKKEDFKNVSRAMSEFSLAQLEEVVALLKSDALYRSEKVSDQAEWLYRLKESLQRVRNPLTSKNIIWSAIATAPAGFCHPRSSMIGTLLEDIESGLSFAEVARRFREKMSPLQYRRPQAAPSAQTIVQAEKIVAQLNAAGALDRRFARVEEVDALWRSTPPNSEPAKGGVFGHLQPKDEITQYRLTAPAQVMTWVKFAKTVLPDAKEMFIRVPTQSSSFAAMLTAENPDAPLIFQWDNPFSWYIYPCGSYASQWGLTAGAWVEVTAIARGPGSDLPRFGDRVLFILKGAKDSRQSGNGLFPEILRSEFHGVRSVIEAYSRKAMVGGVEEASACGILMNSKGSDDIQVRVGSQEYRIDRWD